MKTVFKKYYEMSEDTKDILGELYILNELENLLPEFTNIEITSIKDEEIILKVAIECWYYSNIEGGEIIYRILKLIDNGFISIQKLEKTDIENIIDLITENENDFNQISNNNIMSEFYYKNFKCAFFRNGSRVVLTFEKNNNVDVCIFNSLEEMLCELIDIRLNSKEFAIE